MFNISYNFSCAHNGSESLGAHRFTACRLSRLQLPKSFNNIFHYHCKLRKLTLRSRPLPVADTYFTRSGIKSHSLSRLFMLQVWSRHCFLVKTVTTVRIQKLQHSGEQPAFVFLFFFYSTE